MEVLAECGEDRLLELAALAESYSGHPIARSLREAYAKAVEDSRVANVEELAGRGVKADIDGKTIYAGNDKLMEDIKVSWHPCHKVGTTVLWRWRGSIWATSSSPMR